MANNKIQLADGTVLLDLTSDTTVESDVVQGKTFHLSNGQKVVGTAVHPTVTQNSTTKVLTIS